MSLKAGAKRSAAGPPFLGLVFSVSERGNIVGAVGMWESRSDFQGLWETQGKPVVGFPRFPHARHFHSPPRFFMRCAFYAGWPALSAWRSASHWRLAYRIF